MVTLTPGLQAFLASLKDWRGAVAPSLSLLDRDLLIEILEPTEPEVVKLRKEVEFLRHWANEERRLGGLDSVRWGATDGPSARVKAYEEVLDIAEKAARSLDYEMSRLGAPRALSLLRWSEIGQWRHIGKVVAKARGR